MTENLRWRKSSFSGSNGDCVEVAVDDTVAVRNSNRPSAGTLRFDPTAVAEFVAACRAGEYDDHT